MIVIWAETLRTFDLGPHVFPARKYRAIAWILQARGWGERWVTPSPASWEDLARVHTREYIEDLQELRWPPRTQWPEIPLNVSMRLWDTRGRGPDW